ncbi:MAG: hypothetical protein L3J36_07310 [Rhodobacteraceae bacterium]|nr:hypothetical protein [Paracoccaceae bacterium]
MNILMLLAAGLMSVTVLIHVLMGGPEIMMPLRESGLHPVIRAVMDVIWHAITLVLICMAVALFWLAWNPNTALLMIVSAISVGFGVLFIWYGLTQLQSLWTMPQWIVFLGVPALAVWGARASF